MKKEEDQEEKKAEEEEPLSEEDGEYEEREGPFSSNLTQRKGSSRIITLKDFEE